MSPTSAEGRQNVKVVRERCRTRLSYCRASQSTRLQSSSSSRQVLIACTSLGDSRLSIDLQDLTMEAREHLTLLKNLATLLTMHDRRSHLRCNSFWVYSLAHQLKMSASKSDVLPLQGLRVQFRFFP